MSMANESTRFLPGSHGDWTSYAEPPAPHGAAPSRVSSCVGAYLIS